MRRSMCRLDDYADRSNHRLNEYIEYQIRAWDGTAHGVSIRNAYENGCSYEVICEMLDIDYEDWEEE